MVLKCRHLSKEGTNKTRAGKLIKVQSLNIKTQLKPCHFSINHVLSESLLYHSFKKSPNQTNALKIHIWRQPYIFHIIRTNKFQTFFETFEIKNLRFIIKRRCNILKFREILKKIWILEILEGFCKFVLKDPPAVPFHLAQNHSITHKVSKSSKLGSQNSWNQF